MIKNVLILCANQDTIVKFPHSMFNALIEHNILDRDDKYNLIYINPEKIENVPLLPNVDIKTYPIILGKLWDYPELSNIKFNYIFVEREEAMITDKKSVLFNGFWKKLISTNLADDGIVGRFRGGTIHYYMLKNKIKEPIVLTDNFSILIDDVSCTDEMPITEEELNSEWSDYSDAKNSMPLIEYFHTCGLVPIKAFYMDINTQIAADMVLFKKGKMSISGSGISSPWVRFLLG